MIDLKRIHPIPEVLPLQPGTKEIRSKEAQPGEFARELEKAKGRSSPLRFSAHALERMSQRGIELSPAELDRLEGAVESAAGKGSRSSLVLMKERAFVVSVANRTVITALEGDAPREQIVTQIDSAVIL